MAFKIEQLKRYAQVYLPTAKRQCNFFFHATEDPAASVAAAGYFNLARHKLKVGDVIVSKSGITATEVLQFLDVTAVPGSGDVTTEVHTESGIVGGVDAIANNTGGNGSAAAAAAGVGVYTLSIPITLAAMTTSAADLVTGIVPGHRFKVLALDFFTTVLGTGSGASQTINAEIGTTNLSGGVVNPTLASTDTLGKKTAGSAVTANNVGSATDALSIEVAASGTVFTAGAGVLQVTIQNLDTADAVAAILDRLVDANILAT